MQRSSAILHGKAMENYSLFNAEVLLMTNLKKTLKRKCILFIRLNLLSEWKDLAHFYYEKKPLRLQHSGITNVRYRLNVFNSIYKNLFCI